MGRGARRRHSIRFEKKTRVSDGGGGYTNTWTEVVTMPAGIERVQSFRFDVERLQSQGIASLPTVRFYVDSTALTRQIDNTCRAVDARNGTTFAINFIQDLGGRGRELAITCTENAPT